ncbi:hypothetical protein Tco_0797405 [Tanacetum coccineum]
MKRYCLFQKEVCDSIRRNVVRILLEGDESTSGSVETSFSWGSTVVVLLKRGHGVHLKLVLELLRKEKLYAKVTYLRFIANFSKIVKPITSLTERDQKYEWGAERKEAFQTLKNDLCDASINRM